MKTTKEEALHYHAKGRPGKIEVIPSKETATQRDLTLAYSPGVAEPCLAIEANPEDAYKYTAKGNLVAVISNGTAVLGLGDIGALAGKPVMEEKAFYLKFMPILMFLISNWIQKMWTSSLERSKFWNLLSVELIWRIFLLLNVSKLKRDSRRS